VSAINKLKNLP